MARQPRRTRSIALSTTPTLHVNSNKDRLSVAIWNDDSNIQVRFGENRDADGYAIPAKSEKIFDPTTFEDPTSPIWLWSASGTPTVNIYEVFKP